MKEAKLREQMCRLGEALFDRRYATGGAGNLSIRLTDASFLVTPTGSCLGRLQPEEITKMHADGTHISGGKPSKEFTFHLSLYRARPEAGAVVHLHSAYLTALSCLRGLDPANAIQPFTPYFVMRIGTLPVVPYYRPGDPRIGRDLEVLARNTTSRGFLLANHGPVVLGRDLDQAVNNAEELEETAKLAFLLRGEDINYLSEDDIAELGG